MRACIGAALVAVLLSGCATSVPKMEEVGQVPQDAWTREQDVVRHVKCELHYAVQQILHDQDVANAKAKKEGLQTYDVSWLKNWGATLTLTLVVDEKAELAPGLTLSEPLQTAVAMFPAGGNVNLPRKRSLGLGAKLSSQATRTEKVGFSYAFSDLLEEGQIGRCDEGRNGITGDLQIKESMESKLFLAEVPDTMPKSTAGGSAFKTFSFEAQFIVTKAANATPGWVLSKVAINPTAPFLNGQRVRTDNLSITMGSYASGGPSAEVQNAHLAQMIGVEVAKALNDRNQ